jgi:hypothetical protein
MSNEDVKFQVGAEDTGVGAKMAEVQGQISESVEQIRGKLETLQGAFEKITGVFIAFQAALAGGEAFKEMIESTVNLSVNAQKLGRQLGISATDASVLNVALASVFVTQDEFSAGASKITQTLNKNEDAFKKLGVATRDQDGNFRSTADIMMDTNERLLEFKEGTDRNVEGVKIYGRAWKDIAPTLRVTKEVMEEARQKASELGLVVGAESVAQTKAYRSAMNGVHEVIEGVGNVIGNALLPILTSLGQWFEDIGPQVVNGFKAVIFSLGAVFIQTSNVVNQVIDSIKGAFNILVQSVKGGVAILRAAMTPGESVSKAWDDTSANVKAATHDMFAEMEKDSQEADKATSEFFEHMAAQQTAIAKPKGGETSEGGALKSQMAALQAGLEAQKEAFGEETRLKGQFIEFSIQQEIEYWKKILATKKLNEEDAVHVQSEIHKLEYAADKQGYEEQLAGMKAQEAQYKNNLQAKLAIAQEMAAKIAAAEGGDSSHAKEAQGEVLAIQREINAQELELAKINQDAIDKVRLGGVDAEEKAAQNRVANHQQTEAQLLAQERQFEAERLAITVDGINAQIAAASKNPEENVKLLEQLNAQKIAAAQKYEQQLAALNIKAANEQTKDWKKAFDALSSGFASVIQGMLNGTETWKQAVQQMYKTITNIITSTISNMVTTWLEGQIQNLLASKTTALGSVTDNAAVAGSAAFASTAAIPYVGPELAPAAAAAAFAGAMSFAAGLSAEGGYDIPGGMNPVVQTHQREMILPEEHANTIRGLAGKNTPGGVDPKTMDKLLAKNLRSNSSAITKAIKRTGARFS